MASETLKTLLIAVGDASMGDEAIVQWVSEQAAKWKLPYLYVKTLPNLHINLLEDLQNFSAVVVVVATAQSAKATLEEIEGSEDGYSSPHLADATTLKTLHKNLYQQSIFWHALSIKTTQVAKGKPVSKDAMANGELGLQLLKRHLTQKSVSE